MIELLGTCDHLPIFIFQPEPCVVWLRHLKSMAEDIAATELLSSEYAKHPDPPPNKHPTPETPIALLTCSPWMSVPLAPPLSSEYSKRPDPDLGFQVKVVETCQVAPFSLGRKRPRTSVVVVVPLSVLTPQA